MNASLLRRAFFTKIAGGKVCTAYKVRINFVNGQTLDREFLKDSVNDRIISDSIIKVIEEIMYNSNNSFYTSS